MHIRIGFQVSLLTMTSLVIACGGGGGTSTGNASGNNGTGSTPPATTGGQVASTGGIADNTGGGVTGPSDGDGSTGEGAEGSTGGDGSDVPGVFRVLIIADTHIIGPQYTGNEDNIYMTEANALAVAETVNAIEPQPDFGILLGDVFHDGYHGEATLEWYLDNPNAVSISAAVIDSFSTPIYPLWGNHDYDHSVEYPEEFSHQLFDEFFDRPPYYSIDYKGWKFILANGNIGEQGNGSYGAEQLAWVESELAEGAPTLLLTHYMLMQFPEEVTVANEYPDGPIVDLYQVVNEYKTQNLKSIFVGHTHNFWDVTGLTGLGTGAPSEFRHYVVGATRFGTNNFWIVEFDGITGTYEILDIAKAPPSIVPIQQGTACDYTQPPPFPCG